MIHDIRVFQAAAISFLRYKKQCPLVCLERTPLLRDSCNPDVFGVTKDRKTVEIEIKRSWADFKKNKEKWSMQRREMLDLAPTQFYYLVPEALVERVLLELDHEGLLVLKGWDRITRLPGIVNVRPPRSNRKSKKLSIKEMLYMVKHQTGTLASAYCHLGRLSLKDESSLEPVNQ